MIARSLAASLASVCSASLLGLTYRPGIIDYVIVGLLLSRYVRGPMALYRMPATVFNARMRLVDTSESVDPHVQAFIEQTESALISDGFVLPQRIAISAESPLPSLESVLENPVTGDLANVVAMLSKSSTEMSPVVTAVTFRSAFTDGRQLQTSNSTHVGFWPDQPTHDNVVLPDVRDPLELLQLHRARVARRSAAVEQTKLTRGTTPEQRLAYATRQQLDSTNFLIACGYRKRSPQGVRLTARGATLMAWRRSFPWKQISERQRQRAVAAVMRLV
ncbi:MAG TPA: hypothetical protein VGP25_20700 [Gemmatimonadaceae bacterium]|nr:hypothetical protein [Gemmatimonadaceae bacterium]